MQLNRNRQFLCAIFFGILVLCPQPGFAKPKEVKLNAALKKQLTVFFQDITASPVPYFENGKISNKAMIEFGITQNALRHPQRLKSFRVKDSGMDRIAANYVVASVAWAFGKSIRNESIAGWKYQNGYYTGDAAAFEDLGAQPITKLKVRDMGNGLLSATFSVDMAEFDGEPAKMMNDKATLKKVGSGAKAHFVLVEYSKAS